MAVKTIRGVTVVLGLALLTVVLAALSVAAPRISRRLELDRAIVAAQTASPPELETLVRFHEPEALLALIDLCRRYDVTSPAHGDRRPLVMRLRHSVDLFAASPESEDARPREGLKTVLSAGGSADQRFELLYLLDELDAPTFPREPPGFTTSPLVTIGAPGESAVPLEEAVRPIARASFYTIDVDGRARELVHVAGTDRPWRALLRIAQADLAGIEIDGPRIRFCHRTILGDNNITFVESAGALLERLRPYLRRTIVVTPPATLDVVPAAVVDGEPLRMLRAFAALNGCAVREKDAKTLEVYKP